jgi:hypothetical protein
MRMVTIWQLNGLLSSLGYCMLACTGLELVQSTAVWSQMCKANMGKDGAMFG